MRRYRGAELIKPGFIGIMVLVLLVIVGLQPERLLSAATSLRYKALFTEAGGIAPGNDVTVSGIKVGTVDDVQLDKGEALVTFTIASKADLGSQTEAYIRTGTLLGERVLTLESKGDGTLDRKTIIPSSRTSSPYSLSQAVSELTTNVDDTNTASLNESLDTLSDTLEQIGPRLGPTFDGLSRFSRALNDRNQSLADLLKSAADVTKILSERSEQVNALILNANDLLAVLNERRQVIVSLLSHTSAVSQQLVGLVADNEAELRPTLERMNRVTEMLERNKDNITKSLIGLAKYQRTTAETVSNGFYYNAYVPNLFIPQLIQPFFDYAIGFRRGVDAGQPPDNRGPRAELAFPYNGIPTESDKQRPR